MSLHDLENEHRRLVILKLLRDQDDHAANASILQDALRMHGLSTSRDTMKIQLAWLEEQGLVKTETIAENVIVVELRTRGLDAACGNIKVPGVKKPSPRD